MTEEEKYLMNDEDIKELLSNTFARNFKDPSMTQHIIGFIALEFTSIKEDDNFDIEYKKAEEKIKSLGKLFVQKGGTPEFWRSTKSKGKYIADNIERVGGIEGLKNHLKYGDRLVSIVKKMKDDDKKIKDCNGDNTLYNNDKKGDNMTISEEQKEAVIEATKRAITALRYETGEVNESKVFNELEQEILDISEQE